MLTPVTLALVLGGVTIALAISFLIILLWYDSRRLTNLYFAGFLVMVVCWQAGSMLGRGSALTLLQGPLNTPSEVGNVLTNETERTTVSGEEFVIIGLRLLEFGFTGAALGLYLYVVALSGNRSVFFQSVALVALLALLAFHLLLNFWLDAEASYSVSAEGVLSYQFTPTSALVFGSLNVMTLVVIWQGFRKVRRAVITFGIMLFCLGQLVALLSPPLRNLAIGENAGAIAVLVMSFSLIRAQIIQPLVGQTRQIDVARDVGLVIASRLPLENVLKTIARQANSLLNADGSLIYLRDERQSGFVLEAEDNLHPDLRGYRLPPGAGLVGKVAAEKRSILVNDYRREWRTGIPDAPYAEQAFGAVIGAPLIFDQEVLGVLLVIAGPESQLFEPEDVYLLDLLAPQAAIAIMNGRLFEQERELTNEVATAKTQLETVLSNTDNVVIAVDDKLNIVFANKAARLLVLEEAVRDWRGKHLLSLVPREYLPRARASWCGTCARTAPTSTSW
ncbi:MAG: GAF domain-containing protein [Anaerolineae bacterium]|nr:GAF domain-containing protein [Anaerolineae bacterium]